MAVAVSNHYQRVRYETARRRSKEQQQAATNATYASPASRTILATDTGTVPMAFPTDQAGQSGPGQRFPWPPTIAVKLRDAGTLASHSYFCGLFAPLACYMSKTCKYSESQHGWYV